MTAMMLIAVLNVFYAGEYKTIEAYKAAWPGWAEVCSRVGATSCEIRTVNVYCAGYQRGDTTSCTRYSLYGQMPTTVGGVSAATWLKREGYLR